MRTNRKDCAITWTALLVCVLCRSAFGQSATPLNLSVMTFEFPGDGLPNNNSYIGDFCCTGETASVYNAQGKTLGYIYFYGFGGTGIMCTVNGRSRSSAAKFEVLVSGISNPDQLDSKRIRSSIMFNAREMKPGASHRTVAGALQFTATILDAEFTDSTHSRYWMDNVRVKIDVEQVANAQPNGGRF